MTAARGALGALLAVSLLVLCAAAGAGESGRPSTFNSLERLGDLSSAALVPSPEENGGGVLSQTVALTTNATRAGVAAGDVVAVEWDGLEEPSMDDWVALMVPSPTAPGGEMAAKYKMLWESGAAWREGKGKLSFQVLNHRADFRFVLFRGGLTSPRAAAASPKVVLAHANAPAAVHLALTDNPTQMLVQWITHDASSPAVRVWQEDGRVHGRPRKSMGHARDAGQLHVAATMSYWATEMCGEPATGVGFIPPGQFHYVLLEDLTPGEVYHYTVGDASQPADSTAWSEPRSFRATPPPSAHVRILAVADMGQAEADGSSEQCAMRPSANTTRLMQADFDAALDRGEEFGLVVHNGDVSYARGYVTQWDNFMHTIEGLASRAPYMVAIGNHERDWPATGDRFSDQSIKGIKDSGGECGIAHERRFLMPTTEQDGPWYSFDFGPIHFLQYSTEHHTHPGSPQAEFIAADLAAVDRTRTPWVVMGGHRPMYISSTFEGEPDGDQTVAAHLRADLEALLVQHGVDLTLHGHHHSYQRTCPIVDGKCVGVDDEGIARGPVHLVIGNAGAELTTNTQDPQPEIFEAIHMWWGYIRMDVNATHLSVEALDDATGQVHDTFTLHKPAEWAASFHAQNGAPKTAPVVKPWWNKQSQSQDRADASLAYSAATSTERSCWLVNALGAMLDKLRAVLSGLRL